MRHINFPRWLLFPLLLIMGLLIYSNSFHASFHFDDFPHIVLNELIRMEKFSFTGLMAAVDPDYPLKRPVALISFAVNYWLGGLNPFLYHLFNLLIHITAACGVYLFVKKTVEISGKDGNISDYPKASFIIAALASMLWFVSPVQTQAVTYIVQRMASMAAMFYIYSLLFYISGRVQKGRKSGILLFLSFLFFLMALLTKPNTLSLPFIIVLYEWIFFQNSSYHKLNFKSVLIVFFLFSPLMLGGVFYILGPDIDSLLHAGFAMKERLLTEGRIIIFYIMLMLLPIPSKMTFYHDFAFSRGLVHPLSTLPALVFIVGITIFSLYRMRRDPVLSFFILWFILHILPESLFMWIFPVFEHRLYLPSVGFYAAFSILLFRLAAFLPGGREGKVFYFALAMIILIFSINTYVRNSHWRDATSMWADNVKKSPMIPRPHAGLGMTYLTEGEYGRAEEQFRIIKSIDPLDPAAPIGLGIIYYKRGDYDRAFAEFEYIAGRRALGVSERYFDIDKVFYDMGEELLQSGRYRDARRMFALGFKINPENMRIQNIMMKMGWRD